MITAVWVVLGIVAMIGIFAYLVWSVMRECALHEVGIGPYMCGCIDIPKEGALGKVMKGEEIGEIVGRVIHGEEGEDKAEGTVEGEVLSLEGDGGEISLDEERVEARGGEGGSGNGKKMEGAVKAGRTVGGSKGGWNGWY